jgi:hypothetical protein
MSNRQLMETLLHDIMQDLMTLHRATKSQRNRLRIERYVERILEALDKTD